MQYNVTPTQCHATLPWHTKMCKIVKYHSLPPTNSNTTAHISVLCHSVSQTQHTLLQRNKQNALFKKISLLGMCMFFCCNSWQMKPFLLWLCCCTIQYLDDFLNADDQTSMPQAHWLVQCKPLVVLVCFLEKKHYICYSLHRLFTTQTVLHQCTMFFPKHNFEDNCPTHTVTNTDTHT